MVLPPMNSSRAAGAAGSTESIQLLARRASIIFAVFAGASAWLSTGADWQWAVALAAAYALYNLTLCRRKAVPGISEFFLNVALCAGLTLAQAGYADILYQLLLLRMTLLVGRRRAWRVAVVIAGTYLGATWAVTDVFAPAVATGIAYNLLGAALLTYAAVYLDSLMTKQASDDKQMMELIRQNDRNYRMALTDALTGLYNHRAYKERIEGLAQYVILIIDIDHFKKLNDNHGHLIGDKVLMGLGNIIKVSVRGGDLAFRYGGEEFVVVLPGTVAPIGLKIAERLRQKVADWNFDGGNGRIPVTVSIGMAVKRPGMSSQAVFEQADRALYRAKQSGRNNVQAFSQPDAAARIGV